MAREFSACILITLIIGYSHEYRNAKVNKQNLRRHMESKIVGGSPVSIERFPFMVQLYNLGNMCAGNILNSWTILTAAHCFDINNKVEEVVVQIGSRFVYDFNADTYGVTSVVVHQMYNETQTFACDVALVFLDRPLKFGKRTKKAILVDDVTWMDNNETNFTITGWGWTKYGGSISKTGLMMTHLRFVPNEECGRMHDMTFSTDMFCLYGEGSRDTCKGDSGGGVLWHGMIVGITSHGDGCAKKQKPSVYANVFYFKKWIQREISKFIENYCRVA